MTLNILSNELIILILNDIVNTFMHSEFKKVNKKHQGIEPRCLEFSLPVTYHSTINIPTYLHMASLL